jgi:hypothetical protein
MNGAMAVFPVTTIRRPRSNKMKTIGANQSFFLTFRKAQNSLSIPILLMDKFTSKFQINYRI